MVGGVPGQGWQALRAPVQEEVAAWRRATLTAIATATTAALQQLQAQ